MIKNLIYFFIIFLCSSCASLTNERNNGLTVRDSEQCRPNEAEKFMGKSFQVIGNFMALIGFVPIFTLAAEETDLNFDGDQNGDDISTFGIGLVLLWVGLELNDLGETWEYRC